MPLGLMQLHSLKVIQTVDYSRDECQNLVTAEPLSKVSKHYNKHVKEYI